jgi:hypothetical protein
MHNAQSGDPLEDRSASDERKLREEHLLVAATTLLVRWGYRKTTIDDVAREAGVGKGIIYLCHVDQPGRDLPALLYGFVDACRHGCNLCSDRFAARRGNLAGTSLGMIPLGLLSAICSRDGCVQQ